MAEFDEKWLQDRIIEDPRILGLGEIELVEKEKRLSYGRLDLLMKNEEENTRYEIEIQLGKIDESHIIRTIEYWDEERNRYQQYEHVAVIIAEEITNRFLNVISLFNKALPIIAIQLDVIEIDNKILLHFTKILDLIEKDDDEVEGNNEETNRDYWVKGSSEKSIELIDSCMKILVDISPDYSVNYLKRYVGVKERNRSNNSVIFYPKRNFLRIATRNDNKDEWYEKLEEVGIIVFRNRKGKRVHFKITKNDLNANTDLLKSIFKDAYRTDTEEDE